MEENWKQRTEYVLGQDALCKLEKAHVAVFGVGGVGGFTVEALARAGVGTFTLVDHDRVSLTNINRQIIALRSTVGQLKVEVMEKRIRDINPDACVHARDCFFLPENAEEFDFTAYDYVVDAVDTVTAKLAIITRAKESRTPVISAMGAGNKLDPSLFRVTDIYSTENDPLSRVMRRELRKRMITDLKVVWSPEKPTRLPGEDEGEPGERPVPGSVSFVPSAAGLVMAGEVIRDLCR